MKFAHSLAVLALLSGSLMSQAQTSATPSASPQTATNTAKAVEAKPEDVKSIDSIVAALYDVISGPAGTRDWDRFRSLFAPEGRLIPNGARADGTWAHRVLTVEDFVQHAGENVKKEGFF